MIERMLINGFAVDIARTVKSTYGRCGGASLLYRNGWMIMGVLEYESKR